MPCWRQGRDTDFACTFHHHMQDNIVMGACGVLALIQFPANMAAAVLTGTSVGALLDNGANAIFGLYMLIMLAGALWCVGFGLLSVCLICYSIVLTIAKTILSTCCIRYVVGLQKLLADMKSEQGKLMITKVQNVVLL